MNSSNSQISEAIDAHILTALKDISERLEQLGVPFFIVGAVARDIIAAKYGEASGRRTQDLDLAIMVDSEDDFLKTKAALVESKLYQEDCKQEQRLHYCGGVKIDLIPFGKIADNKGEIHLPPTRAFVMNVRGFKEAYDASEVTEVSEGFSARVVTVEGLVLLKLIAWNDRPSERLRDIEDIDFIFREYQKFAPDSQDLLYEKHTDILATNGHDIELASIQLLAMRLQGRLEQKTLQLLRKVVGEEPRKSQLLAATPVRAGTEYHIQRAEKGWEAFLRGLGNS